MSIEVELRPAENVGAMNWTEYQSSSKTYSNLDIDVAKSALQKYIRRGNVEKAEYSAFELWRMAEIGATPIQSNMYNRLAVACSEDIGPANLPLAIYVIDYVNTDVKDKTDRFPAKLAAIVQQMALSSKTRIMSHLWKAYATSDGRVAARERGVNVDDGMTLNDLVLIGHGYTDRFFRKQDPEPVRKLASLFYFRVWNWDPNAFYWLAEYLNQTEGMKVVPRNRRSKPVTIIWEMLGDFLDDKIVEVLKKAYFIQSEGLPFLQTAVVSAIFRPKFSKVMHQDISEYMRSEVCRWENSEFLEILLKGMYTFQVDHYVVDMHTRWGRRLGRGIQEFKLEGSRVENEDPTFIVENLQQVYNSF